MNCVTRAPIVLSLGLAAVVSLPTTALAASSTFSNPASIAIPAAGTAGPANPYPSTIAVTGVTGTVTKVTVSLFEMSHTFPDDIDILLVGPTGQTVVLMSDAGGSAVVVDIDLTFDDAAAASLPNATAIASGTYKPTNYGAVDNFPSPAPASPYGTTLGPFNGQNPNGTWSLYVIDDLLADVGDIADGWSVTITTADITPPTITITTPPDGAEYLLDEIETADYGCADDTGLVSCEGPVASGGALDTSTVGSHEFTVNAVDVSGNASLLTHVYTVVYLFTGFLQPVDNPGAGPSPVFNKVKAGSGIPVKFSLDGDQGLDIFPAGSPVSKRVTCDGSATADPVEETVTAGKSSLQYDPLTDTYTYVWKTEKQWKDTCRVLMLSLDDGTEHLAYFNFTK